MSLRGRIWRQTGHKQVGRYRPITAVEPTLLMPRHGPPFQTFAADAKWNTILSHLAVTEFKSGSTKAKSPMSGIVRVEKTDSGYKFYPKANISIQGQDANDAWRMSVELANLIDVDIAVECEWRDKVAAAHPGKKAILINRQAHTNQ